MQVVTANHVDHSSAFYVAVKNAPTAVWRSRLLKIGVYVQICEAIAVSNFYFGTFRLPFHMKIKTKYILDSGTALDHAFIHVHNNTAKQTLKTYPGNKYFKTSLENQKVTSDTRKTQII